MDMTYYEIIELLYERHILERNNAALKEENLALKCELHVMQCKRETCIFCDQLIQVKLAIPSEL